MSSQQQQSDDSPEVAFRGDSETLTNLWVGELPVGKIIETHREKLKEAERRIEELESALDEAKGDAELALATAGEVSAKARPDGGPTKTKRAELLSRNEVVRRVLTTSGPGGSVTGSDVIGMARPETNLDHRLVRNAWDNLVERWDCFEIQEPTDRHNRLAAHRDDLDTELVRLVDKELSDEKLTERFSTGRS